MNSVAADPALPLTFSAALELAERNAPQLTAEAAKIDVARSAAIPAGELPDPRLFFGIEGFPVSGPNAGTFDQDDFAMETIGVMQEVTNAGKRKARSEVAVAAIDVATADQVVERLRLRQQTAQARLSRLRFTTNHVGNLRRHWIIPRFEPTTEPLGMNPSASNKPPQSLVLHPPRSTDGLTMALSPLSS